MAAISTGNHGQSSSRENVETYMASCVIIQVETHGVAGGTLCHVALFQTQFSLTHSSVMGENRPNIDDKYCIQNDSRNNFLNLYDVKSCSTLICANADVLMQ